MKIAAFTITRNEPIFLRAWCNYYCNALGQENCHIIDNSSTDESVNDVKKLYPNVTVHNVPSPKFHDGMFLKNTVEKTQRNLLRWNDVVVFAETDEFLIPSLKYTGLRDYCEKFFQSPKQWVRAKGWNIVQQVDTEPPIGRTPGSRLIADRNSMWRIIIYDKTLITKVPLVYQKGFHIIYQNGQKVATEPVDPDLALLHAWRIDLDEYYRRHHARYGITREQAIEYFKTHQMNWAPLLDPHAVGPETKVPDHWKSLIYL